MRGVYLSNQLDPPQRGNEWREVPEERLVSVCAFHAVWTLETAAVLKVRRWRKEGSMDQPRFSVVHITRTIPYSSIPPQGSRGNRDVRLRRLHTSNN